MTIPRRYDSDAHRYGRFSQIHDERITREHLLEHLRSVITIIEGADSIPADNTDGCAYAVPWSFVDDIDVAKGLLENIYHALPHVQCWVAGYYWSGHWSGFYGCKTKRQAERIAAAAVEKKKTKFRRTSAWEARWTDIDIVSCVKPMAKPADVIWGLYS